jgi:hypothetical protein
MKFQDSFDTRKRSPSFGPSSRFQASPSVHEYVLKSGQLQVEPRSYLFLLKENPRGRFLRVTEKIGDHFASIIIPAAGLEEFGQSIGSMIATAKQASIGMIQPGVQSRMSVERKKITFILFEDAAGWCLRLIEEGGGRANELVIPANLLESFVAQVNDMVQASNEQPIGFNPPTQIPARPALDENILASVIVPIERKSFMLLLKENRHGRFLRITEKSDRGFACVFVPASGLEEFQKLLDEMIDTPVEAAATQPQLLTEEITLNLARMHVQGKTFVFRLKENARGQYLRLIEESPGHDPVSLVLPVSGLEAFKNELGKLIKISAEHPPKDLP